MAQQYDESTDLIQAQQALAKRHRGKKPSRQESAALRRVERKQEETRRWQYYRTIPQKHWREMSGRQTKVLKDQARYGIPFSEAVIDLPAVVKALHDFLAANARRFQQSISDDPLLEGASQTLKDQYVREQIKEKKEKAKLARLEVLRQQSELISREATHEALARAGSILRAFGERLQRQFGDDAHELLNETLDDVQREFDAFLVSANDADSHGDSR